MTQIAVAFGQLSHRGAQQPCSGRWSGGVLVDWCRHRTPSDGRPAGPHPTFLILRPVRVTAALHRLDAWCSRTRRVSVGGMTLKRNTGPARCRCMEHERFDEFAPPMTVVDDVVGDTGAARSRLVLVDVDRTLLRGSSLVPLARVLLAAGMLPRRLVVAAVVKGLWFQLVGSSDRTAAKARERVLAGAAGCRVEELDRFTAAVAADLADEIRPSMASRVTHHLDRGDFVVLLSAAPQPLVESLAERIGAHRAVGTKGEVVDGVYTGRLDGPFCYGDGKLERLCQALGPVELRDAVAYADSVSDLPVLQSVGAAWAVQPDRRLRAVAAERGWPVLLD